uniref:Uncharacterized protein n=1 Tax=Anopheles christyi TaxID=43041 RepID=A0A182JZZ8_9DIPT
YFFVIVTFCGIRIGLPPHPDTFGQSHLQQQQQPLGSNGAGVKFPPVVGIYRPPAARRALKLAENVVHQLAPPAACEHPNDYGHLAPSAQHHHPPATQHQQVQLLLHTTNITTTCTGSDKVVSAPDSTEGHLPEKDKARAGEKTSTCGQELQTCVPDTNRGIGSDCAGSSSSCIGVTAPSARTNRPHRERRPDRAVYVPRARRSLTTPPVAAPSLPQPIPPKDTEGNGDKVITSPAKVLLRTTSSRVQFSREPGTSCETTAAAALPPSLSPPVTVSSKDPESLKGGQGRTKPLILPGQLPSCNTDSQLNCDTVIDVASNTPAAGAGQVSLESFKKVQQQVEQQRAVVVALVEKQSPERPADIESRLERNPTETAVTMQRNNQRNRNVRNGTTAPLPASMLITDPNETEKIDRDEKELRRASQEINRSNRRIMKQTFNSDVLEIGEPTPPVVQKPVKVKRTAVPPVAESCGEGQKATIVAAGKPEKDGTMSNGTNAAKGSVVSAAEEEEEEDDWETMYDDNGDCLNPKMLEELTTAVGQVSIETPQSDYKSYETKQAMLNEEEFPHVLEVSNFPAEFKTQDLMMMFSQYKESGFDIKWVDDTHALAVFSSSRIAAEVLTTGLSFACVKPLGEATAESRSKARKCASSLQPYRQRPETCAAMARRMVSSALGVKLKTAPEERENERRVLREAKERKRLAAKQRDEIWETEKIVTVHDVDPLSPIVSNPLADLESVRKIANEKLRIRRLVQVREQSKQLAAKVRQNYQQAKEKELAKIDQIKRDEVNAWKRQQIRHLQDEYARNVCEVGEAHRAAEAAEECAVWFEEKRATQQAVALQRGRVAEANATRERERKETEKMAKQRKKQYVPTKSIAVQASIPIIAPVAVEHNDAVLEDCDTSTEPTPSPYEQFRSRRNPSSAPPHKLPPQTILSESEDETPYMTVPGTTAQNDKENIPRVGHEYSATAFTSPSDLRSLQQQPPTTQRLQPFTQITELIQQRRQRQHTMDETRQPSVPTSVYGTQKTVQFDDLSDNTLSFPTSTVLTHDNDGGAAVIGSSDSPRKVPPRKTKESARHHPSGVQKVSTAVGNKCRKAAPPVLSVSSATSSDAACTKVQYYDCNTMHRKEYDQPVGYVQREERRLDDPTGMEEANRYELLQQELAKARSKPTVDRTKPALEKQQTRKDYEKLSKELDNLTRAENKLKSQAVPTKNFPSEAMLKQKAGTRQRKASEAIEQLLQQRALVTCPIVQTHPDAPRRPTARPSVVNVAEMKYGIGKNQPERKDLSTDSCASIVLDTFDRPGIPLPSEAIVGNGMDKIAKLKELLQQINEQRRLLMEDIAREKANEATKSNDEGKTKDSTTDHDAGTKQEIDRLERMKRRQEELLQQQQLLQQREREVEELSRQLDEKMVLLQRNQKQRKVTQMDRKVAKNKHAKQQTAVHVETKAEKGAIDVEVVESSSVTSSISEVSKDSYESVEKRTGDGPVKIIITVNDKGTSTKRKKKTIEQKKRSQPKEDREAKSAEKVQQPVAANPEAIKTILKPLPTRKDNLEKKVTRGEVTKVIDLSPGSSSTTSTVYRPLPPKIGSLKILQKQQGTVESEPVKPTASGVTKVTSEPKHHLQKEDDRRKLNIPSRKAAIPACGETNLNPNLMKYIVRLLGMSRQSIDQLGVSTTSVSTPSESVVNVSSNVGGKQPGHSTISISPNEEEIERMNRLKKFIDENYNFLQEIDETLRRSDQSTLGSSSGTITGADSMINDQQSVDADISRVEGIWMETLRRRERRMQRQQKKATVVSAEMPTSKAKGSKKQPENEANQPAQTSLQTLDAANAANRGTVQPASQQLLAAAPPPQLVAAAVPAAAPTVKEGSLKSILKSPKRDTSPSKVAKIITPQGHVEVINLSDRDEQKILEGYSQLTDRCTQRITELSQMINQVREEKRRLIEDSLSSLEQQESTKYMDLPVVIGAGTAAIPLSSRAEKNPPRPPNAVGSSPPGDPAGSTVPVGGDDPVSEEIDNIFSSKQIGLSKDSGIAMSRPLTASDIRESPSEEGSQGKEPLPFEPFLKDIPKPVIVEVGGPPKAQLTVGGGGALRRSTPPVAIARFSPQLPDEMPMHELSTIPEVETPAVAMTSRVNDLSTVSATAADNANSADRVLIEARNRLLLNDASPTADIGYDRFPNYEEYVRSTTSGTGTASFVRIDLEKTTETNDRSEVRLDMTEDRVTDRLVYRKFPGAAPAFDITEDGETTSQPISAGESMHKSASDTSLPDVVAELRKWNIFVKPFNNSLDNSNRSTPSSEAQEPATSVGQRQPNKELPVARLEPAQLRTGPPKDSTTSPLQQLSDSFRRDLEIVSGLRWGSSMLKRTTQLEQHSSGSSPNSLSNGKLIGPNDDTVANEPDGALGKPPNLAEFIMRELMVRSQSELQSLSSVSSSSQGGSHSTLIRSLLNLSRLNESNSRSSPIRELLMHTPTEGKSIQRTSTPVASKSTASGSSFRLGGEGNTDPQATNRTETGLFSGESRLSSVHWSSSSGNSSDRQEPPQQGLTVPDIRLDRQSLTSHGERK